MGKEFIVSVLMDRKSQDAICKMAIKAGSHDLLTSDDVVEVDFAFYDESKMKAFEEQCEKHRIDAHIVSRPPRVLGHLDRVGYDKLKTVKR